MGKQKNRKKIKAGKIGSSNLPKANDKQSGSDDQNITLDLSYPALLKSIQYKQFSNYFQTASDYMLYVHYLNFKVFPHLSGMTKKDFMTNEAPKDHVHVLSVDERSFTIQILKKQLEEMQYPNIDEFIEQNLNYENEFWQYGLDRSGGRMIGIFRNNNVFMPVLYDPNHLLHKTEKGRERRFTNPSVYSFSPSDISHIEYPKKCIRCNCSLTDQKLIIPFEKDIGLRINAYICYDCFEKTIMEHYGGEYENIKFCLEMLQDELSKIKS